MGLGFFFYTRLAIATSVRRSASALARVRRDLARRALKATRGVVAAALVVVVAVRPMFPSVVALAVAATAAAAAIADAAT